MILTASALSGCITIAGPQIYVKEKDQRNILTIYSDGSVISSENGVNFAGKYRQDDNRITVTWNFLGLVEFYTVEDKQTLVGPEPKKDRWVLLSKPKSN